MISTYQRLKFKSGSTKVLLTSSLRLFQIDWTLAKLWSQEKLFLLLTTYPYSSNEFNKKPVFQINRFSMGLGKTHHPAALNNTSGGESKGSVPGLNQLLD